ncbi:hypothetical protein ACFXJM_37580 [Streptomyces massasporeus]
MHLRAADRALEDLQGREDVALGLVLLIPRRQTVLAVLVFRYVILSLAAVCRGVHRGSGSSGLTGALGGVGSVGGHGGAVGAQCGGEAVPLMRVGHLSYRCGGLEQ